MANISDFIHILFDSYLEKHKGFVEVRTINEVAKAYFFSSVDELIADVFHLKGNVYFGICPRQTRGDGTKKNIKFIVALWADIDVGTKGHKKPSKYNDMNEALKALRSFEYPPSIIINSGYGLHCYWLLKAPEEINTGFVEGVMKGISGYLGGDSTQDITRILRVPETMNLKYPDEPKSVKIIKFEKDLRYSLSDFNNLHIPCLSNPEIVVSFEQNIPKIDLNSLKVSDKTKNLIQSYNKEEYPSRSEQDQAVILALVSAGCIDAEIRTIFSNSNFAVSQKYLEKGKYGDQYLAHSIRKARTLLENNKGLALKDETLKIPPLLLSEFLNQEIPPTEYYIEDVLVKQGKAIISAPANLGKSILAQSIALALTTGQTEFLGKLSVIQAKVLYLDLEMGDSLLQERFRMMVGKDNLEAQDLYVKYLPYFDLPDDNYKKKLEEWIFDSKINVVIIDPIGNAWFGNENDKQEVGKLTAYLNTLIDKYKISVLLIHHWRKAAKGFSSGGEMAAGSYKWSAWTDNHITLGGVPTSLTISCQKARSSARFKPFLVKLNSEILTFEFLCELEKKFTEETLKELFNSFGRDKVAIPALIERAKEEGKGSKDTIRKLIKESKVFAVDKSEKTHYLYRSDTNLDGTNLFSKDTENEH